MEGELGFGESIKITHGEKEGGHKKQQQQQEEEESCYQQRETGEAGEAKLT